MPDVCNEPVGDGRGWRFLLVLHGERGIFLWPNPNAPNRKRFAAPGVRAKSARAARRGAARRGEAMSPGREPRGAEEEGTLIIGLTTSGGKRVAAMRSDGEGSCGEPPYAVAFTSTAVHRGQGESGPVGPIICC